MGVLRRGCPQLCRVGKETVVVTCGGTRLSDVVVQRGTDAVSRFHMTNSHGAKLPISASFTDSGQCEQYLERFNLYNLILPTNMLFCPSQIIQTDQVILQCGCLGIDARNELNSVGRNGSLRLRHRLPTLQVLVQSILVSLLHGNIKGRRVGLVNFAVTVQRQLVEDNVPDEHGLDGEQSFRWSCISV